ncbi:NAD(P)-binding domain-containing protein [Bosea sp. LjRoot9]|uniref:NAD(P)-binding domain-containing protein n=1 Tax=Bosea sp. LjRoot9 TaxID=3342341 RepID=UPI003ECE1036
MASGDIGFIGAGTLTVAVVHAVRARSNSPTIRLSPRSHVIADALARELPNIIHEATNSAVVEKSDILFLSVRPQQLDEALSGLQFRPDQIVASFVATVPVAEVTRLVRPAERVCRVTPLPTIALAKGPIIISPAIPDIVELFGGLGDLILTESESEIMDLGSAAGFMSTFFEIEHALVTWLTGRSVPSQHASLYIRSLLSGLADVGLQNADMELRALVESYETKGGLNEHVRLHLKTAGLFDLLRASLDSVSSQSLHKTTRPPNPSAK